MKNKIELAETDIFEVGHIYRAGNDRYICVRATLGMATLVAIPPVNFPDDQGYNHDEIEVAQCDADNWLVEVPAEKKPKDNAILDEFMAGNPIDAVVEWSNRTTAQVENVIRKALKK